jgi:hypothetical protein
MSPKTSPLSPEHVPATRCANERDQALADVFTTALEGGIGYWSQCSRYAWSVDGTLEGQARDFVAVITETEDEDQPVHIIDRTVIARGIRKAYEHGNWADYHATALRMLNFGRYDEADYDSDTADLIVQFGLFGEQVYA